MCRQIPAVMAAALMMALANNPAEASDRYKWCAYYNLFGGATNCGFNTFAQCQAAISGIGGVCQSNPAYTGGPTEDRSRRRAGR